MYKHSIQARESNSTLIAKFLKHFTSFYQNYTKSKVEIRKKVKRNKLLSWNEDNN